MKSKNVFIILLTATTLLFAALIIDFILAIFWAIVLAILFSPINNYLGNKINKPAITSLCTIFIIFIVVLLINIAYKILLNLLFVSVIPEA